MAAEFHNPEPRAGYTRAKCAKIAKQPKLKNEWNGGQVELNEHYLPPSADPHCLMGRSE